MYPAIYWNYYNFIAVRVLSDNRLFVSQEYLEDQNLYDCGKPLLESVTIRLMGGPPALTYKESTPMVSICCITYNQVDYIRDAIEGFMMQKTTFPFEILIHDDASTDGTTEIVKSYAEKHPNLIFPMFQKENQYSKGKKPNPEFNYPRARGKYIALCEGDDYWIDPFKLQKQFSLLESNDQYIACFTNANFFNEIDGKKRLFIRDLEEGIIPSRKILLGGGGLFPTASLLFRKSIYYSPKFPDITELAGDDLLIMTLSMQGRIYFLDELTCVYRRWSGGVYSKVTNDKNQLISWAERTIMGLTKLIKISKRPYREYLKERLSKESFFVLKNIGLCKGLKYFYNLNAKDFIRLMMFNVTFWIKMIIQKIR